MIHRKLLVATAILASVAATACSGHDGSDAARVLDDLSFGPKWDSPCGERLHGLPRSGR